MHVSPLKTTARIIEKAALRPTQQGWAGRVCDVVRAMVVADSATDVVQVLQHFTQLATEGTIVIRRVKDRFAHPTDAGWRDVLINLTLSGHAHVCEVQVVSRSMLMGRKGLSGQQMYSLARNAFELLELFEAVAALSDH